MFLLLCCAANEVRGGGGGLFWLRRRMMRHDRRVALHEAIKSVARKAPELWYDQVKSTQNVNHFPFSQMDLHETAYAFRKTQIETRARRKKTPLQSERENILDKIVRVRNKGRDSLGSRQDNGVDAMLDSMEKPRIYERNEMGDGIGVAFNLPVFCWCVHSNWTIRYINQILHYVQLCTYGMTSDST